MKLLYIIIGIIPLISSAQKDTCAVLTGLPLNSDSYETVKHILEEYLDCYVKEVSLQTDEIATADLSNVKFLYWAGGPYLYFQPSKAAAENIRNAIAKGMGYFGTCGGSLIAVDYTPARRENQLGIFPGFQPFGNGTGMRDYDMNLNHPVVTNSSLVDSFTTRESIHYNGGGSDMCPSMPGLVNWVVANDVLRETPALTATMYGKGRVFLSVAHPERSYIPATWKFVRLAAEWCLGRSEPKENLPPKIKAHIPYYGETNVEIQCTAAGSDDPEGYPIGFIWDFGDGSELAYTPVVNHAYSKSGEYKIELTVTDGINESTYSRNITIKVPRSQKPKKYVAFSTDNEAYFMPRDFEHFQGEYTKEIIDVCDKFNIPFTWLVIVDKEHTEVKAMAEKHYQSRKDIDEFSLHSHFKWFIMDHPNDFESFKIIERRINWLKEAKQEIIKTGLPMPKTFRYGGGDSQDKHYCIEDLIFLIDELGIKNFLFSEDRLKEVIGINKVEPKGNNVWEIDGGREVTLLSTCVYLDKDKETVMNRITERLDSADYAIIGSHDYREIVPKNLEKAIINIYQKYNVEFVKVSQIGDLVRKGQIDNSN